MKYLILLLIFVTQVSAQETTKSFELNSREVAIQKKWDFAKYSQVLSIDKVNSSIIIDRTVNTIGSNQNSKTCMLELTEQYRLRPIASPFVASNSLIFNPKGFDPDRIFFYRKDNVDLQIGFGCQ